MMIRFVVKKNCGCRAFNGELQAASKKAFGAYKQGRPGRERPDSRCDFLPLFDDRNPLLVFRFVGSTWLRRELQYGCLLALA
jgi:hypothetical protein